MDGVTDAPFRYITARYGKPDVIFTEFTPVEGIAAGAVRTLYSLIYDESERPVVAQFFGKTPAAFYGAAVIAAELGFDGIDINMGCPAKNIAGQGSGAGLILDPPLAKKIIKETKRGAKDWADGLKLSDIGLPGPVMEYVNSVRKRARKGAARGGLAHRARTKSGLTRKILPVSVKTRLGYEKDTVVEWVKHLLEEKPAAITIHGRTFRHGYSGDADWDAIAKAAAVIRKAGAIAIGNGDVKSMADARERAERYEVDGVLIGRAALGNPWIFAEKTPSVQQKFKVATEHAKKYSMVFGRGYFSPMKKHLAWYCRGFPGAAAVRQSLMTAESFEEVEGILKDALAGIRAHTATDRMPRKSR
jgi:tRNA-dihydrouridine synthase